MSLSNLKNTIQKLKQLRDNPGVVNNAIIDQNLELISDMQKDRISAGKNSMGEDLEFNRPRKGKLNQYKSYTSQYSRTKLKNGGQVTVVDLTLSGSYKNQIKATRFAPGKIDIGSSDPKEKYLEGNYDHIYGFTPEDKSTLLEVFKTSVVQKAKTVFL